jgi:hypothetical protein
VLKQLAVCGLVLSLVLAACGGGDGDDADHGNNLPGGPGSQDGDGDEGGDHSDFHACSLFTAQEIGAVTEEDMQEGREHGPAFEGATGCTWESSEGPTVVFVELRLEGGQDFYEATMEGVSEGQLQEVQGIGDVARWDTFLGVVEVVDDDRFISVQPVIVLSEVDNRAVGLKLAEMAVERLP